MTKRRASGGLESEVLAALWASQEPLTAKRVMEKLGGSLAYNTVQTILVRLHAKGAVQRSPAGRAHAYAPVLDEAGLAARRMRRLLDRGKNQAAILSRFVGTLTTEEEEMLTRLLRDSAQGGS